ncbi:pilus assembly protein PilP [Desulfoprunum benzoelyticum]|uniref:Type IV pilus assembly protein PilP n=1 Tax=Desulfoprunum benzoelyticum TaxID=1506996 RepID=A0A840UQH0_9BACT|nr:pilus assembly protein PilP [Desulfoprunum benzoelyticum]MBB5347895.1 type IV pilus assembly protein PilP [Desulfoprunum benzoelyticum]MBM9530348.1 pilus assembly protein PilP [Desulfoprunum benzoelyticum]
MKKPSLPSLSLTTSSFLLYYGSVLLFSFLLYTPVESMAADVSQPSVAAQQPETTKPPQTRPFDYIMANRPDPFLPFITDKTTDQETGDPNEIIDQNEPLTGMQLFEPAQLSLVALMETGTEKLAMVQDSTGKGYVLTEGTKIGRRGTVKAISPNKVLIEELAETRGGKKILSYIDMVLKKEGEK